ncbi:MAG: MXAN_5187 C-terminal domain-containing protein [Candidatus Korobacteraceae bacterium]
MTTDEELAFFEDSVRRLKVEYDIYFGGGSRRAPTELDWRVQGLIKKYSDSQRLSSPQRFKYNTVVQRYAIYSDLWRQKLRIKEEGYRRPQDALLGIQGLRTVEASQSPQGTGLAGDPDQSPQRAGLAGDPDQSAVAPPKQSAVLLFADSDELDGIRWLYETMQSSGGEGKARGSLEAFAAFLRAKTKEIQNTYGCSGVKYTVEVKNGRAQIKARPNL